MFAKSLFRFNLLILPLINFILMSCKVIKTVPTQEVVERVYSISDLFVNMYLMKTGENYIAIDTGFRLGTVTKRLKDLKIDADRVIAVFITHSHFDHIAAMSLFKNANIYLSSEEKRFVDEGKAGLGSLKKEMITDYIFLNDQQIIEREGLQIKAILTPGHTPGSMCYLVNNKYLFIGDILGFDSKGKAKITPSWLNVDTELQKKTSTKFTKLPGIQYVFSSHGGYTDDFNRAFEYWNE